VCKKQRYCGASAEFRHGFLHFWIGSQTMIEVLIGLMLFLTGIVLGIFLGILWTSYDR
jgi:hypothetical protein